MLCFFNTHCSLRLIVRSELDVPTFAIRRLHACHHATAPSGERWNCGRKMSGKFRLNADFHVTFRSFTCRKATTWDRRLYFPSEGRCAEDFFALKIRRLRQGVNPRTWVPKASTLPLDHWSCFCSPFIFYENIHVVRRMSLNEHKTGVYCYYKWPGCLSAKISVNGREEKNSSQRPHCQTHDEFL
jgi:hypothetical protein